MGSSNWFLWQKSSVSITTNWAKTEIWDGFLWKVRGDLCQKTLYNVEAHTRPVESSKVSRLQAFPLLQYLQSVLGNDILAIQVPVISWYYSAGSLLLSSCVWIIDSAETFFLVLLVPKMTYLTVFELIRLSSMFVANLNCFETHVCTLRQTLTRGDHLQVGTFKSFTVSHCFILGLQAMRASRASQPPMAIPKNVNANSEFLVLNDFEMLIGWWYWPMVCGWHDMDVQHALQHSFL